MQGRTREGSGRTAKIGAGRRGGRTQTGRSRPIECIGFVPEGFSAALSLVDLGRKVKLRSGPTRRYAGRQSPETSDDFRLADGRPLWYAFLNDPNVLTATDANRWRDIPPASTPVARAAAMPVRFCAPSNRSSVTPHFEKVGPIHQGQSHRRSASISTPPASR